MDLDDPHHVRVHDRLKYAGKSEEEKYKFKNFELARNSN
jgi:hypothetical protein